ncbi:tail assembly protein [Roseococcus pinisoli]|uniref:Tail assembly protein n=1 Tax=Roseococcus pinisoli TaxID=2835040 RepID=A0ABS5QGQ2_9PROT|nr:hypothetical protein [Roseococcus pinisoli]MBS7812864.1 tail assembly protein [Roseococcus pinisoli]
MSETIYADPMMQMRKVVLHGRIKRIVKQEEFNLMAASPREALMALCTQVPGFQKTLGEGWYRCILASPKRQVAIAEGDDTRKPWQAIGNDAVFHIIPVVKGAGGGRGGAVKIVLGVVLVAATIATAGAGGAFSAGAGGLSSTVPGLAGTALGVTYGQIVGLGAMMALGGVSQLLSPQAKAPAASDREAPDQRASFMFQNPVNVVDQGGAIPIPYGDCLVGSSVIAAGMNPYDFGTGSNTPDPVDEWLAAFPGWTRVA